MVCIFIVVLPLIVVVEISLQLHWSLYLHDCFDEIDIQEAIIPGILVKFFT
jgi:hypothetical protein